MQLCALAHCNFGCTHCPASSWSSHIWAHGELDEIHLKLLVFNIVAFLSHVLILFVLGLLHHPSSVWQFLHCRIHCSNAYWHTNVPYLLILQLCGLVFPPWKRCVHWVQMVMPWVHCIDCMCFLNEHKVYTLKNVHIFWELRQSYGFTCWGNWL